MSIRIHPLAVASIAVSLLALAVLIITDGPSALAWILALIGGGMSLGAYLAERRAGEPVSGAVALAGAIAFISLGALVLWVAYFG